MVSCGGNRERSERERAQRRKEKQGTRESRGSASRRWSRALKVVASIATRSSAGWKRGGGRHSELLLLLGWPATTGEAEARGQGGTASLIAMLLLPAAAGTWRLAWDSDDAKLREEDGGSGPTDWTGMEGEGDQGHEQGMLCFEAKRSIR